MTSPNPARDEAVPTDAERFIASFTPKTPRDAMALTLFKAWVKADPKSIVAEYPASYLANFVDMADAALASPASGVDAVATEIARLRPHYQSGSHLDHGRRQILDHFEKFTASLSPAATSGSEAGGEPVGWAAVYDGDPKMFRRFRDELVANAEAYQAIHPVYFGPAWRHQED